MYTTNLVYPYFYVIYHQSCGVHCLAAYAYKNEPMQITLKWLLILQLSLFHLIDGQRKKKTTNNSFGRNANDIMLKLLRHTFSARTFTLLSVQSFALMHEVTNWQSNEIDCHPKCNDDFYPLHITEHCSVDCQVHGILHGCFCPYHIHTHNASNAEKNHWNGWHTNIKCTTCFRLYEKKKEKKNYFRHRSAQSTYVQTEINLK